MEESEQSPAQFPEADGGGGRTASPADEQPATNDDDFEASDPGVGPAHIAGTTRGEDISSNDKPADPGDHSDV
jgi:hypothetical protein